ncbi:hypothetical protein V5O39_28360 [Pseudomonas parakoreensis]
MQFLLQYSAQPGHLRLVAEGDSQTRLKTIVGQPGRQETFPLQMLMQILAAWRGDAFDENKVDAAASGFNAVRLEQAHELLPHA